MEKESLKSFRQRMAQNQYLPNNSAFFKKELKAQSNDRARFHITSYFYASNSFYHSNYNEGFTALNAVIDDIDSFPYIPEYARIYNLLGLLWFVRGNKYMAVDMYMKGIQLAKQHQNNDVIPVIYSNLGLCYLDKGLDKEAIKFFLNSLEYEKYAKPSNVPPIHINLGEAYLKVGMYKEALDQFLYGQNCGGLDKDGSVELDVCFMEAYYGLGDSQKSEEYMNSAINGLQTHDMSDGCFEAAQILFNYLLRAKKTDELLILDEVLKRYYQEKKSDEIGLFLVSSEAKYYHLLEDYKKEAELLNKANQYLTKSMKAVADEAHKSMLEKNKMAKLQKSKDAAQKKNQTLAKLATTDSLTGLLNRHAYNKAIITLNKSKKTYKYFSCAFIDIDNFKNFNDKYGHLAGDECLTSLGGILLKHQKPGISFYRFGGDEFVGFFENMSKDEVVEICKSINSSVLTASEKSKKPRTLSFGIYTSEGLTDNLITYLNYADEALYRSKNSSQKGRIEIIK